MLKKILIGIWIGSAAFVLGACMNAPVLHGSETNLCPVDGTHYPFGSCVVPEGVLPAPASMNVEQGADTKVCASGFIRWECPGSYEIPQGADPVLYRL